MLLNNYIDTKQYRSILCLNGDLPARDFFTGNLPVIAADGAANTLISMGVTPHAIIGDLDSVHDHLQDKYQLIRDLDQDINDYQKSLRYMQDQHLLPAIVTGIHGGHLDHVLNNINIFLQSDNILYAPPLLGMIINANASRLLTLAISTKISLIGFPEAIVSSSGLKWELKNYQLSFPGDNSCFNRVQHETVKLEVAQGKVLVLVYLEEIIDAGS